MQLLVQVAVNPGGHRLSNWEQLHGAAVVVLGVGVGVGVGVPVEGVVSVVGGEVGQFAGATDDPDELPGAQSQPLPISPMELSWLNRVVQLPPASNTGPTTVPGG